MATQKHIDRRNHMAAQVFFLRFPIDIGHLPDIVIRLDQAGKEHGSLPRVAFGKVALGHLTFEIRRNVSTPRHQSAFIKDLSQFREAGHFGQKQAHIPDGVGHGQKRHQRFAVMDQGRAERQVRHFKVAHDGCDSPRAIANDGFEYAILIPEQLIDRST